MNKVIKITLIVMTLFLSNDIKSQTFDLTINNNTGCSMTFRIFDMMGNQLGLAITSSAVGTTNITCISGAPWTMTATRANCTDLTQTLPWTGLTFSGTFACGCGTTASISTVFTPSGGSICPPVADLLTITIN